MPIPSLRRSSVLGILIALVGLVVAAGLWTWRTRSAGPSLPTSLAEGLPEMHDSEDPALETIEFPRVSWSAAELEVGPVVSRPFEQSVRLTGKVMLNEDHVAHIFPLVDGRVDEVRVQFGDKVKRGDLLVVVQSKEVGQAMLQLYQDRMQRDFAIIKNRWTQAVASHTLEMIQLIRDGAAIEEIEQQLRNRPIGGYRETLMSAYISFYKSRKQLDRLAPLSKEGVVTAKQLLEAEAEWNASRAGLQAIVEQLQQDAQQGAIISQQTLKELETRVSVDETNLKILGFNDEALHDVDPAKQGETISHYPIYSPFDGTIISKDVVLLERVGPESQILSIADLSTVWISTDIYEENFPLLKQLENQTIHLTSNAWPNKAFEAKIFYTGDVLHEATRTISMRAKAENPEGLLKPGMFVNVEFSSQTANNVLQIPLTAIQEYEGKSFVFVHQGEERFQRRDITLGHRNAQYAEVRSGLKPEEIIVLTGGFALKSRMLESLLSE